MVIKKAFFRLPVMAAIPLVFLAACGTAPVASGVSDPNEGVNRRFHAFNKGVDRNVLRPVSYTYGHVPKPVRQGVSNFAENLELPADVINGVLQGRPGAAVQNTGRFLVNSTIGVLGLFDPASRMGMPEKSTDFGETLYVWGTGEGPYVENPLFGPSTQRDTFGKIVDTITNPLNFLIETPESTYVTVANGGEILDDRYTYGATIDDVLYDSADSYSQARLAYLQNRRFTLERNAGGGTTGGDSGFIDPYAGETGAAATTSAPADFIDPYEDANAQ